MRCPRCGLDNPENAKFCNHCGTTLGATCPICAHVNPLQSRFCSQCGRVLIDAADAASPGRFASPQSYTPAHLAERILTASGALEGERKQVTVLFADLRGSMELLADRDPEEAREILDPVVERMIEAVHRYEGMVNQVMGDGIMALFGAPIAHEDHALRACYAALRIKEQVKGYADEVRRVHGTPLHIRMGLNSGEVVVRSIGSDLHLDYTAVGSTTHLAARMEQLASPDSILITPHTLRLVEGFIQVDPLGPLNVKGLNEPLEVFELTGANAGQYRFQVMAMRGLTRFVGRDAELEQLRRAMDRVHAGNGQVGAVVGEPGMGKSRLLWEFTHSHHARGWLVLEAGGVSYGKSTPYMPVIDLLRVYCKIGQNDNPRDVREKITGKILALDRSLEPMLPAFCDLLGVAVEDEVWRSLDASVRRRRTIEAVKGLLLRESQVQPVMILFEDLHWIDTESQVILDTLVESLPASRLLLLVNYRPEYRHAWGSKSYYAQLRLDPLPHENATGILQSLLGSDSSLQPLKALLLDRAEGNPFFLEEGMRMLVEQKVLAGQPGAYRLARSIAAVDVPPTVQATLAARIDRLSSDAKRLLQMMSVIGKDVPFSLLQATVDMPEPEIRERLAQLSGAEFVYEIRLFPDLEYTFKHALTHDVAYSSLLKERRRELHRRVGEALERQFAGRLDEQAVVLSHHFLESGDLHKGFVYSTRAAERAEAVFAHGEALEHYSRARAAAETLGMTEQLTSIDEAIGDVYIRRGLYERAAEAYGRALDRTPSRERRAAIKLKIGRVWVFGDPRGIPPLREALEELDPATQPKELAQATGLLGRYHHYAGEHEKAVDFLHQARVIAESLEDWEGLVLIYGFLSGGYQHLARFQESMEWARRCIELGERYGVPSALVYGFEFLAESLEFTGRLDESLWYCARSEEVARRIGSENRLAWAHLNRAVALYGLGHLRKAEREFAMAEELGVRTGERRMQVWVRSRRCLVRTDLGADDNAHTDGEAGMVLANELGDLALRAFSRFARAYHHFQRDDLGSASALLDEMSAILSVSDNRYVRVASGACAAEVVLAQERFDDANELINTTLALSRDAGMQRDEAVARRVQGQILVSLRQWDEARAALGDAVTRLDAFGSQLELGRALYHRGRLSQMRGDVDVAGTDLTRALGLFAEIGAVRDRERVRRLL